jgi:L-ascorbate metabolism protein UlaG (beta-lactamase superfamily)
LKNTYKTILFIAVIVLCWDAAFGQSNEIKIKFIGNCGLYMTDGNMNIYFDFPYKSGAFNYMEYDSAELDSIKENSIFVFTHKHPDHYASRRMRKVIRKKQGQKYGKWNIDMLEQLSDTTADFSIQAIETNHSLSFKHYSYLMTWHGKKIYISGDCETADTILTMTDLDWAFVPTWIVVDAIEKEKEIDAKMIGVYHLYPTQIVNNGKPEKYKILENQGEVISLTY